MSFVVRVIARDKLLHQTVQSLLPSYDLTGRGDPDLLVAELSGKPECPGVLGIRNARKTNPNVRVIVISRKDSAAVTQQIVRMRVDDYFILPSQGEPFSAAVAACADCGKTAGYDSDEQPGLIGQSANIVALRKYVSRVALSDSNVLILGETGVGKELVAELIHKSGPRRNKPFVAVNAAAVPEPLFESELFGYEKGAFTGAYTRSLGKLRQAHGGTIFFDEIGDIGPGAQAKLLRAIETREVYPLGTTRGTNIDVRLVAATNRDIDSIVRSGEFRQDLFYRLDVVRIDIPPLRTNREDIPLLLTHFVSNFNHRFGRKILGFEQNAADLLAAYDWPGNIRQLRNVVEGCFVNATSDEIGILDFPSHFRTELESKITPESRGSLMRVLQASDWNISRAAWQLHCSRMTVYRKMARYCISRNESEIG